MPRHNTETLQVTRKHTRYIYPAVLQDKEENLPSDALPVAKGHKEEAQWGCDASHGIRGGEPGDRKPCHGIFREGKQRNQRGLGRISIGREESGIHGAQYFIKQCWPGPVSGEANLARQAQLLTPPGHGARGLPQRRKHSPASACIGRGCQKSKRVFLMEKFAQVQEEK